MKNAVELVRVSTEHQAGEDRAGIPAQREANRKTARAYGLTIVRTIEIVDVSGSSVLKSPEMQELLRLMESTEVHAVVTKEFSRLMRPEKFTDFALLQHFIDTNTLLYLPDGPIDLASKTGRLLGTIRAAVAGMERREIVERMQDAKEAMRRAGRHTGGASSLPFGVGYTDENGWFYTADAEKVREAFRLFLSGETSYQRIGERMHLARTNVRFILENPIYTGWRVYDEKRDPSPAAYVPRAGGRQGHRRKMKRAPEDVIRVRVLDGLVAEEDFARAQQIIELKRQKHWRSYGDRPARYTYNGFLVCGNCENLLYTHTSKYDFYQCKSNHVRARRRRALIGLEPCDNKYMLRNKLEPKLDHLLGEKLRDREFLERVLDEHNEAIARGSEPSAAQSINARLSALQGKRQRVLEAFFDGVLPKGERDRRIVEIDREVHTFQHLLLSSTPAERPTPIDEVLAAIEPLTDWEFLEREDKRKLLALICPEISVFRYAIKSVKLNVSPASNRGSDEDNRLRTAQ